MAVSVCFLAALFGSVPPASAAKKKPPTPIRVRTVAATASLGGPFTSTVAVAACPGRTVIVGGGFATTSPEGAGAPFTVPYESKRIDNRRWRASRPDRAGGRGRAGPGVVSRLEVH